MVFKILGHSFHIFFRLKSQKCDRVMAGIRAFYQIEVVVCCTKFISRETDTLKILGTPFSYNKKL